MSFASKAQEIRNSLKKYKKNSIIYSEIKRLSNGSGDNLKEVGKMPWLSFLLIEWLYQVEENENAVNATDKNVYKILNKMYQLQREAVNLSQGVNLHLALRRMLLGQLWCQLDPINHQFTLVRLFSLMIIDGKTQYFEKDFLKITKIELLDFFQFSLFLLFASIKHKGNIKYEQILINFYPKYSISYIARMVNLVAGGTYKLISIMSETYTEKISQERYFSSPQLLAVPFFKLNNQISSLHLSVSSKGLAEFVLNTFKLNNHEKFRKHFSKNFEYYVGIIIEESEIRHIDERQIKSLYKCNKLIGKVIDFLLIGDDYSVFIDAKAIEPKQKLLITDDSEIIRQRLKDSFTKGIEQSFECAQLLAKIDEVDLHNKENRFSIVVTHQDFYLSNGVVLREQIANKFFDDLADKYNDPIPVENIHFCSIEDFEGIMMMCKNHKISLSNFLRYCSEQDSNSRTKKFDMRQHLQCFLTENDIEKNSPIGTEYLKNRKDELFNKLLDNIKSNNDYWKYYGENSVKEFIFKFYELIKLVNNP